MATASALSQKQATTQKDISRIRSSYEYASPGTPGSLQNVVAGVLPIKRMTEEARSNGQTYGLNESGKRQLFTPQKYQWAVPKIVSDAAGLAKGAIDAGNKAMAGTFSEQNPDDVNDALGGVLGVAALGMGSPKPAGALGAFGKGPTGLFSPEILKELAWGAKTGRNPQKLANEIVKTGRVPEEDRDLLKETARAMRDIHKLRSDNVFKQRPDDIAFTMYRLRDAAARNARVKEVTSLPIFKAWSSDRAERIKNYATLDPNSAEREARLATVEAIAREARKRGLEIRHTSNEGGRVTSRYIKIPGGGEVRVSDHELPSTPQREYQREVSGGPRWTNEIVVDDWRLKSLDDYMKDIIGDVPLTASTKDEASEVVKKMRQEKK